MQGTVILCATLSNTHYVYVKIVYPGLVPKFSGKLTSTRISSAQVMVEYFSSLTYVYLMRSTSQEETLSGKAAFEIWSDTFGVKIN